MSNDFLDDDSPEDWSEFKVEPEQGDLKVLNDLIKKAGEVQVEAKSFETGANQKKAELKNILEVEIPQKMQSCGYQVGDFISFGGTKIELRSDTYANVPSLSAISDEKDDNRRQELLARREAGLAILEDKAPTLIKRKYEISIDRENVSQAQSVKTLLKTMEDPPEWTEGLSVHPATLSKWVKEVKSTGTAFTSEEEWAFGIFPRKVAKITK